VGPVDSAADKARFPDEWATRDEPFQGADQQPLDRRDSTSPDQLRERIDRLPPGHPSSPYDADGTPRQPIPRLRDLETFDGTDNDRPSDPAEVVDGEATPDKPVADPERASHPDAKPAVESNSHAELPADRIRPFTDAEWKEHVADVRTRLDEAQAEGLSTDRLFTIDPNGQSWNEDRRAAQDSIINSIYAEAATVPNQHMAVIAGGLPGAGKTTVLGEHAGIDRSQYLMINPDNIKEDLARRGLIPDIEGLSPMEASDLVHEESSYVARQLALRAQADGKNVIWDITMSSRGSAERRINELRAAGYEQIEGIFVDIPVDVSARRADARHRAGEDDYRAGVGLGGRYIPPDIIGAQADPEWGCQNHKTFQEIKYRFDSWTKYDNSIDWRDPVLVETSSDDQKSGRLPHG
jgi:predicted kinase